MMVAKFQSGPLPPAQELIAYNQAHPDAADRIIRMAEQQAEHRRALENRVISSDQGRAWAGLIIGGIIGLGGMGLGAFVIISGYPTSGLLLGGGTLGSLVGTFVYGSQQRRADMKARQQPPARR